MLNCETDVVIGDDRGSAWSCAAGEPGVVGVEKTDAVLREGVLSGDGACFLPKKERNPIDGDCVSECVEATEARRSVGEPIEAKLLWLTDAAKAFLRLLRTHLISAQLANTC